jgi:nucleoid DNA-binding protein
MWDERPEHVCQGRKMFAISLSRNIFIYIWNYEIKFHGIALIPKPTHAAEHLEFAVRCMKRPNRGERVLLVDGGVLSVIDRAKRSAGRWETARKCKIENVLNITFILKIGKKQFLLNLNGGTPRSKSRNTSVKVTKYLGPSPITHRPRSRNT